MNIGPVELLVTDAEGESAKCNGKGRVCTYVREREKKRERESARGKERERRKFYVDINYSANFVYIIVSCT